MQVKFLSLLCTVALRRVFALGAVLLLCSCGGGSGGGPGGNGGGAGGSGGGVPPAGGTDATTFSVGGTVSGLAAGGSFGLSLNNGSAMQVEANGAFSFAQTVQKNASYAVVVTIQPTGQTCSVSNGNATATGNVTNVLVTCLANLPPNTTLSIGGSVAGMAADNRIKLLNNGAGPIDVNANSSFSFVATSGASYSVSVARNPLGQLCEVTNASGIAKATVSNIAVICRSSKLSILTGSGGGPGRAEGIGNNARFNRPQGNAIDSAGNVFVADTYNQIIRKITPDGSVTNFAGAFGANDAADGIGESAHFCRPLSIAIDKKDFLYVTDSCNGTIRKISPAGVVTTLAGKARETGSVDGAGAQARFGVLAGIAVDDDGTLYVSDFGNHTIRRVSSSGVVSTLAGSTGVPGLSDGIGGSAKFSGPNGIAVDAQGIVYVADGYNQVIRAVTPTGHVSTLAGTAGHRGNADGLGSTASFSLSTPQQDDGGNPPLAGLAVSSTGTLYLTDYFNNTIRTISPSGLVTTIAGQYWGYFDGQGMSARFWKPSGISIDASGNLYVSEDGNFTVRKISPLMLTSTFAGRPLLAGKADGPIGTARFNTPFAVAADAAGNLYIADFNNNTVRKVSSSGVTTTLAGTAGVTGTADGMGSAALFYHPAGIAVDSAGNVYVSDVQAGTIRKITPSGLVTTLAGTPFAIDYTDGVGKDAHFFEPRGLAVDAAGNVYVADMFHGAIRKITPSGLVTTMTRDAPGATGVAVDANGNVYFSSSTKDNIQKIGIDGTVTLLAGGPAQGVTASGDADGLGTAARFATPQDLAIDAKGNLYVADGGNCTVRMVSPIGAVTTIAGVSGQCEVHEGALPALLPPILGLALTPDGRQLMLTGANAVLRINGL